MAKRIGVVGAGTAGLHLGLHLRKHDVDVTIFTPQEPSEYAGMRLLNTVAHHSVTIKRENDLQVNHWPSDEFGYFGHYYEIGGPNPLSFYGDLKSPSRAIDYRIYQPKLMEDFLERGGKIDYREVSADEIESLARNFDLLVVCTGKGSLGQMFEHRPEHSPFEKPQRALCVGLFRGVSENPIRAVTMSFAPGAGELISIPTQTFNGMQTALVIENIIGGDMEVLAKTKYEENPKAFLELLLGKLRKHHPKIAERIDEKEFDLANSHLDLLQGGVTPTVRKGHKVLEGGKIAMALGDVTAVVDPVLGQGANMASYAAIILGEEIVNHDVYDERFCELVANRQQDRVLGATRWTNFMLNNLRTLPLELQQFIFELSQSRDLADEFTDNFNYPERQWDCFASPDRIRSWLERTKKSSDKSEPKELVAA